MKKTTFPEALRVWRKANGFSQEKAAEFLDVPWKTYVEWERGRQKPTQIGPILKLLGMPPPMPRQPPPNRRSTKTN